MAEGGALIALQIAAIATAAGGTALSLQRSRKAQRSQEKADAVASAQAELENKRNIRQAIASGRVQRAQLIASGQAQTGGFGSSPVKGALGSARTQVAANIGFANQTIGAQTGINRNIGDARRSLGRAAEFSQIAALPSQFGFQFDPSAFRKKKEDDDFIRPENNFAFPDFRPGDRFA